MTTTIEAVQPANTTNHQPAALSVPPSNNCLGIDLGMGAIKLFDQMGSTHLPSFVAVPTAVKVGKMIGLAGQKPPMKVKVKEQEYFVGTTAHDFGRPIENLDYERLTGSPEMTALLYGALTRRIEQAGEFPMAMICLVGLPLEPLAQERANQTVSAIRRWLLGEHCWLADGKEQGYIDRNLDIEILTIYFDVIKAGFTVRNDILQKFTDKKDMLEKLSRLMFYGFLKKDIDLFKKEEK